MTTKARNDAGFGLYEVTRAQLPNFMQQVNFDPSGSTGVNLPAHLGLCCQILDGKGKKEDMRTATAAVCGSIGYNKVLHVLLFDLLDFPCKGRERWTE